MNSHHCRDPIFTGNDRAMRHHSTDFGDQAARKLSEGTIARRPDCDRLTVFDTALALVVNSEGETYGRTD